MARYKIDFWDAFDGWITAGFPEGRDPKNEFDDLEKAKEKCKQLMLGEGPFGMDEHYGVIDLEKNREVFCGKAWYENHMWKIEQEQKMVLSKLPPLERKSQEPKGDEK